MDDVDLLIADLVSDGSLEVSFHSNGTVSYQITDVCMELHPQVYEDWMNNVPDQADEDLIELETAGLVEVSGLDTNGNLVYSLTEEGRQTADIIKQAVIS